MTLKFWLIIAGVLVLVLLISTLVAYFKGKKAGAATAKPNVTQHDVVATDALAGQMAEAKKQLEALDVEIESRRKALEEVLAIKDEAARLKALSDLANKWKTP